MRSLNYVVFLILFLFVVLSFSACSSEVLEEMGLKEVEVESENEDEGKNKTDIIQYVKRSFSISLGSSLKTSYAASSEGELEGDVQPHDLSLIDSVVISLVSQNVESPHTLTDQSFEFVDDAWVISLSLIVDEVYDYECEAFIEEEVSYAADGSFTVNEDPEVNAIISMRAVGGIPEHEGPFLVSLVSMVNIIGTLPAEVEFDVSGTVLVNDKITPSISKLEYGSEGDGFTIDVVGFEEGVSPFYMEDALGEVLDEVSGFTIQIKEGTPNGSYPICLTFEDDYGNSTIILDTEIIVYVPEEVGGVVLHYPPVINEFNYAIVNDNIDFMCIVSSDSPDTLTYNWSFDGDVAYFIGGQTMFPTLIMVYPGLTGNVILQIEDEYGPSNIVVFPVGPILAP